MKVAIPAFENVLPTSLTGPYDILTKTSGIHAQVPGKQRQFFDVRVIPFSGRYNYALPAAAVSDDKNEVYDLVIIPAMQPELLPEVLQQSQQMISWLKWQYNEGAELASICLGAFLLASTGLLDGKRATTHWLGVQQFRAMFPQVTLEDDKVIVDEGRIYSCGGAFSYTAFMMYLIEKFCGHDTAAMASKVFLIDMHKQPQNAYAIFTLQKEHGEKNILDTQEFIERNFQKKLSLDSLSQIAKLSRRTFLRKFKKATGNTPLEYIQRVRVEQAKKWLENSEKTVEEISLGVGYDDYSTFRTLFKRFTGNSPIDYRKRYRKMIVS